jgi:hypothetical protein
LYSTYFSLPHSVGKYISSLQMRKRKETGI